MAARRASRALRTTGQLLAVIDDPALAPGVIADLARAGVDPTVVTLLRADEGADRIDATGAATGRRARLRQALSFTMVDQVPDFSVYEAALRDGRVVLALPVRSDEAKAAVRGIFRSHGAHFINHYGRFATEEVEVWRGPELELPGHMRR
jgi:hypothetical protein